ncbi:MAG TPA: C4-dicarboxylic acid transporter DauA [Phycisphaerae bacterium]|nr:C4-dicarboxylic acid transporter DauA [Phycisphaerae bacterium]
MPQRHRAAVSALSDYKLGPAAAIRKTFRAGYHLRDFRADLLAGMIVGVVALPLSMALAIASGVPPQHGLYTAIVAGAVIALLGGSSVQVSGPTAAFVVILAPISAKFGVAGLMVATLLAGCLLTFAGLARLGRLIEFIPYPVTTGFTSGIAVVIAMLQLKDFFGLSVARMPEHFLERAMALARAFPTTHWPDLLIGLITLAALIIMPRISHRLPSPLIALPLGAVTAYVLHRIHPGFDVATIQSRFSFQSQGVAHPGIPQLPPLPIIPWHFVGPDGLPFVLSLAMLRDLAGPAFAIAMLGAIESLLSAVVSDGMTGVKHDPDAELLAQGVGNIVAPFFGGIAATGAIARTATNIRFGARSPVAALCHALFVLTAVLLMAPILGYLPMASMAALLFIVAWNMSEVRHFVHVIRVGPGSDVLVMILCFGLTVVFDMTISVTTGVLLAALLFMRRMAEVSSVKLVGTGGRTLNEKLPIDAIHYEIDGPLFFGAAHKAMSALRTVEGGVRTVILDLTAVPTMDATALVNLESAIERLRSQSVFVIVAGAQSQPLHIMAKAGWKDHKDWMAIRRSLDDAIALAWARYVTGHPPAEAAPAAAGAGA